MSEANNKDRRRIAAYRKELAGDPKSLVFVALAEALNRVGEYDESAEVAQQGLRYHDGSVAGLLALAVAEAGRNNIRKALEQIKAALIIDEENPRALALMGSLLLQKGLAKRAVQFLKQAVKLDGKSPEYADLLKRAKRLAKSESSVPLPSARGASDTQSPWAHDQKPQRGRRRDGAEPASDAEHTVFDPDGVEKLRKKKKKKVRSRPPRKVSATEDNGRASDAELTAFAAPGELARLRSDLDDDRKDRRSREDRRSRSQDDDRERAERDHAESHTTFDVRNVLPQDTPTSDGASLPGSKPPKKPKVGGSAAEYSKLIQRHRAHDSGSSEPTVAAPEGAFVESATVDEARRSEVEPPDGRTSRLDDEDLANIRAIRPPPEAPSVRRARTGPIEVPKKASLPPPPVDDAQDDLQKDAAEDDAPKSKVESKVKSSAGRSRGASRKEPRSKAEKRVDSVATPRSDVAPSADAKAESEARAKPKSEVRAKSEVKAKASKAASEVKEKPAAKAEAKSEAKSEDAKPAAEPKDDAKDKAKEKAKAKPKADPAPKATPKSDPPAAASEAPPDPAELGASGRPATMFVDDAVWAIYGGERPDAKAEEPKPEAEPAAAPAKKPAAPEKKPEKKPAPAAPRRRSVLVVRTSERFGQITQWLGFGVLLIVVMWVGYSAAVARSGAAPVDAREDIKGIAADMERGGLASLRAAEEAINVLLPNAPDAKEVLVAALADVQAESWRDFGKDPALRKSALQHLEALGGTQTVESISARVALSTSSAGLSELEAALADTIETYPESPKAWLIRAKIAERQDRKEDAIRHLYQAKSIHPKRRDTLLALARWHARNRAYGTAFTFFDELLVQDAHGEDVEALLERYVLGVVTGADPAKNEAESRLAGLIREELPHVANDEVGRVSLAFALATFGRGDTVAGLEQLANAESAYERSAAFKGAVGSVLVAAGEWARAKDQFEKALALDPTEDAYRVGRARAEFGEQAKLRAEKKKKSKKRTRGVVRLPFGTVRLRPGRFELVEAEYPANVFPEAAYAAIRKDSRGGQLERRLEAKNLIALAELKRTTGRMRSAIKLLDRARSIESDAEVEVELGRAYLSRKDYEAARESFQRALKHDRHDPGARYGLATALVAEGEVLDAMDTLEPLTDGDLIAPDALRLLSQLKRERGDDAGALDLLEKVLRVSPRDARLRMEIGRVQHHRKRFDEAVAAYRLAVDIEKRLATRPSKWRSAAPDPREPIDLYYLGRVMLRRSEKRGKELLFDCTELEGAPPEAHFFYGKTLVRKRRSRKKGRQQLSLYLEAAPDGSFADEARRLIRGR